MAEELNHPLATRDYADAKGLTLTPLLEARARLILQIARDDLAAAGKVYGIKLPAKVGQMSRGAVRSCLCLGPEEWLLLAPAEQKKGIIADFAAIESTLPHSLVDVSERQVGLHISGPGATEVLNAGCPLDLENMPAGTGTRSLLDKAQITLIKVADDDFQLEILRSYAPFVWELLETVARQNAVEHSLSEQSEE